MRNLRLPKEIYHSTLSKKIKTMTGGSSSSSSCGACKFLRRRCMLDCTFAPYFSYEQAAAHFEAVHRVFGASNVSKMLLRLPLHSRGDAAAMISYEALARVQDPVYGCVAHVFALQQQVAILKEEIENTEKQMANLVVDTETSSHHSSAPSLVNQACCTHIEMQRPGIEHQLCFESSVLDKLLQDLREDNYFQPT